MDLNGNRYDYQHYTVYSYALFHMRSYITKKHCEVTGMYNCVAFGYGSSMEVLLGDREHPDEDPLDDIDIEDVCIDIVDTQATTISFKITGPKRSYYANETIDQRAKRLAGKKVNRDALKRKRYANETVDERAKRIARENARTNACRTKRRDAETADQKEARRAITNAHQNELRAARIESETPDEEISRKQRECASNHKSRTKTAQVFHTMFGDGLGMIMRM